MKYMYSHTNGTKMIGEFTKENERTVGLNGTVKMELEN